MNKEDYAKLYDYMDDLNKFFPQEEIVTVKEEEVA